MPEHTTNLMDNEEPDCLGGRAHSTRRIAQIDVTMAAEM